MEIDRIKNLYQYIKAIHVSEHLDDYQIDCKGKLKPVLRSYQKEAVKWMLKREKENNDTNSNIDPAILPKGGILADEMGLGKTVEVLACLLSNPCPDDILQYQGGQKKKILCKRKHELCTDDIEEVEIINKTSSRKRMKCRSKDKSVKEKTGLFSSKYNALRAHYESALSQMSFSSSKSTTAINSSVKCFCDNNDSEELYLVQCEGCGKWQHADCLGIAKKVCYEIVKCPQCWTSSPLVPSKTTLIITPSAILDQWINEIDKHIKDPDFKLRIYNGVKNHNYIQPTELAEQDVILTTYNVLCSDLNFIPNPESERKLRHAKRYFVPSSPLTCLKLWRICLDEAQMVEGYTTKAAVMASQLNAVHRWAVSGTPIQKSIHDLYGLVHFLRVVPYEQLAEWQQLLNSDDEELFRFLSGAMWRNSKQDVLAELGVPSQTVVTHMLHFSPVEGYFYRIIHTECETSFRMKLSKFDDLDIKLTSIDRKHLQTLLLPLLGVRQACTHPQVVRGKFVRLKHTMTMEELMTQMISKARLDADIALRQLVSSLHGIAAIHAIQFDWSQAVQHYRRVLQLNSEYQNIIKVDSLQMIHCLYNLAEILENHGVGIPPTLHDDKLREEAQELESKYLQNYEKKFAVTQESLSSLSASVAHLCRGDTLGLNGWWEDVINNEAKEEELLKKIRTFLDDNDVPGQQSITSRLSGLHAVHREFAVWIATADSLRIETLDSLRHLQISGKSFLFERASMCHLNDKRNRKKRICPICQTEMIMKKYEAHIFSINKHNLKLEEESEESEDEQTGEGKKLKETKLFKSSKEGSWKPTPQERMLQVLASHAKRFSAELGEDGSRHLQLLETIRKEFKWIRVLWRNISDQIYGTDELAMAKLRLRLPLYEDEINQKQKQKTDIFVVEPHEVPLMLLRLEQDSIDAEASIKRTSGTFFYLQNLQKSGGTELDPCPVCKESLKEKWSVLHCGHCYCFECIPTLLKMGGNEIDCPLCRIKTPKENVSYVVARPVSSEESSIEVKGSHSSKVTAVISQLLLLMKDDRSVKVLIFSTWEKVLDVIRDALVQNDITFRRLKTGDKFQNSLSQFKAGSINVLLMPLKLGAKGLNLTEATHLFFVEPILNPAEEQQAVGRIHRIGQTKPTFVHRFVVRNTIEEKMLSSLETGGQEEWAKENVTLRKLNDLFILREENSNNVGEEEDSLLGNEVVLNTND